MLQYFIKPLADSMESMKIQDRTIVGKQWVSEEILQENGLEYRSYGEGGYSIAGKLKTASPFNRVVNHTLLTNSYLRLKFNTYMKLLQIEQKISFGILRLRIENPSQSIQRVEPQHSPCFHILTPR